MAAPYRLTGSSSYRAVLSQGKREKSNEARFDVKFLANMHGHARLGYVIPKRLVPTAVRRNATKRLIREAFRVEKHSLPAVDLIVRQISKAPGWSKARLMQEIRGLMGSLKHD